MNTLTSISDSIDALLDKKEVWTTKERLFYEMLVSKVDKYQNLYSDAGNIIRNIKEQPLFVKCRHPDLLCKLVSSIEVITCKISHDHSDLKLKLGTVYFVVEHSNRNGEVKYRVSFRDEQDVHGYVAYFSAQGQTRGGDNKIPHRSGRHLPEYDKIMKVLPGLDRVEIIHLATELLTYYDTDDVVCKLHIGNKYPISLVNLAFQAGKTP